MSRQYDVMTCDALTDVYASLTAAFEAEARKGGVFGPVWCQLIKPGHVQTSKGDYILDDEAARVTLADWQASGAHDRVVDSEHATLGIIVHDVKRGTVSTEPIPAPAAGWFSRISWRGMDAASGGIWALMDWLDEARALIRARKYRFVSPVFWVHPETRRVFHMDHAALTNNPAIKGMMPIAAKSAGGQPPEYQEDSKMKKTLEALGLPPEATDDAASAAVLAMKSDAAAMGRVRTALAVADGQDTEAVALAMKAGADAYADVLGAAGLAADTDASKAKVEILAMKTAYAGTGDMGKTMADLQARLDARDAADTKSGAEQLVMKAMGEGKVTSAMKDSAMAMALANPRAFEEFAAKAPVIAPMGKAPEGRAAQGGMGGSVTDNQTGVFAQLGMTPERATKALGQGGQ